LEPHRDRAAGGHLPVLLPAEDRAADPAEGRRVPHARARRARIMYLHPDPGAGVLRETLAVATSAGFSSTIENSRRRETEDKQLAGGSGPAQGPAGAEQARSASDVESSRRTRPADPAVRPPVRGPRHPWSSALHDLRTPLPRGPRPRP